MFSVKYISPEKETDGESSTKIPPADILTREGDKSPSSGGVAGENHGHLNFRSRPRTSPVLDLTVCIVADM